MPLIIGFMVLRPTSGIDFVAANAAVERRLAGRDNHGDVAFDKFIGERAQLADIAFGKARLDRETLALALAERLQRIDKRLLSSLQAHVPSCRS
jgi:hypothetical protein